MVRTNEHGQVLERHHDGSLDAVVNVSDDEVHLLYRDVDGTRRTMTLEGVCAMCVSNFRNGNIILDALVHPVAEAKTRVSSALLQRLGHGDTWSFKGDFVFVLEASYGAEVVADCHNVEFSVGWTLPHDPSDAGSIDTGTLPTTSAKS